MTFFVEHEIAIDLQVLTKKKIYKMGLMKMQIHCTVAQIHGTVCLVAHGTEEGLIPKNVLHICTFLHIFLWPLELEVCISAALPREPTRFLATQDSISK